MKNKQQLIEQFYEAIAANDLSQVQDLINQGADVNEMIGNSDYTALRMATISCDIEMINYLVSVGAGVNAKGNFGRTLVHAATKSGNKEALELLLNAGADVNAKGTKDKAPLHLAARNGNKEKLELLLKAGANFNTQDIDERTPVHAATKSGNIEALELLLKAGADVNARDLNGEAPVHLAATNGKKEIIEFLLKAGANINAQTDNGEAPLHAASEYGNEKAIQCFINAGAKLDVQDHDGKTALQVAISNGKVEIAKLLIIAGADVEKLDISSIADASLARNVKIAKVVQNLCKLQGDKNTIELGKITDEERILAKEIIIDYLIKNGMPNTFFEHLEKFAPIELIKNASDDISISHDIRELLEERLLQIKLLEYCLHEMNKNLETKFSATTTSNEESGSYLLSMIKTKEDMSNIKNVSVLSKFMLYQFMNSNEALKYQVEELTKSIFPADKQDIQQLLIKELKALNAYKSLLTPEDYKEAALFLLAAEEQLLATDETEGKPTKVLDKILDNEENLLEAPNSAEILEKALTGGLDHAD